MLRFFAPLVLALALPLAGCGSEEQPAADPTGSSTAPTSTAPTPSGTPSGTPSSSAAPPKASGKVADTLDLTITPGMLGEVRVGMRRAEWERTGQLEEGAALCAEQVRWAGNPKGIVVLTDDDATITQILVSARGPRTDHGGIGVGSTYGELRAAYPDLTPLVDDGFDGASTYPPGEEDGRPYLGFLLGVPAAEVSDSTEVVAIAVTGGEKAYFQYDC